MSVRCESHAVATRSRRSRSRSWTWPRAARRREALDDIRFARLGEQQGDAVVPFTDEAADEVAAGLGLELRDAADVEPVVDAAYRFALAAPLSASTEVGLRYGFASGFDAGLRWGPAVKGLDVGWQLHGPRDASDGWAGTLLLGWSSRKLGALGTAIEDVFQGDASLTDYTLTYVTGWEYREIAHVYLGGRFIASRWKAQIVPDIPIVYDGGEIQAKFLGTDASGGLKHWGGFGGVALGYKRVWIGAELSLLWTSGSARIMFEDRSVSVIPNAASSGALNPAGTLTRSVPFGPTSVLSSKPVAKMSRKHQRGVRLCGQSLSSC